MPALKIKNSSAHIVEVEKVSFDRIFDEHRIGVGDKLSEERILNLAVEYRIEHILQKSSLDRERQIATSILMIEKPELFFKFPLSSVLDPTNVKLTNEKKLKFLKMKFKSTEEKNLALKALLAKIDKLCGDETLRSSIKLIADELMCNAIFNAPFVVAPENLTKKLPKRKTLKTAQLIVGKTTDEIIIGVQDKYGSLDVVKLLARVRDCFSRSEGAGISNLGNYGAGLGTFMVFSVCSSMYFAVEKNQTTLVCCTIPMRKRRRKERGRLKSLHLIIP